MLQTVDVAVMQLKDSAETVDAATTAVCGSSYFSAAAVVSAAAADAADAETTAACGLSCSFAAVAAETSSAAMAAANYWNLQRDVGLCRHPPVIVHQWFV